VRPRGVNGKTLTDTSTCRRANSGRCSRDAGGMPRKIDPVAPLLAIVIAVALLLATVAARVWCRACGPTALWRGRKQRQQHLDAADAADAVADGGSCDDACTVVAADVRGAAADSVGALARQQIGCACRLAAAAASGCAAASRRRTARCSRRGRRAAGTAAAASSRKVPSPPLAHYGSVARDRLPVRQRHRVVRWVEQRVRPRHWHDGCGAECGGGSGPAAAMRRHCTTGSSSSSGGRRSAGTGYARGGHLAGLCSCSARWRVGHRVRQHRNSVARVVRAKAGLQRAQAQRQEVMNAMQARQQPQLGSDGSCCSSSAGVRLT